ncbi:MAG: hypothetical protein LBN08_07885 [Lactobacillales bacterium]|jgi:hypothetical protein|nr:hypothetical protein [Lactobacillales bacterium]
MKKLVTTIVVLAILGVAGCFAVHQVKNIVIKQNLTKIQDKIEDHTNAISGTSLVEIKLDKESFILDPIKSYENLDVRIDLGIDTTSVKEFTEPLVEAALKQLELKSVLGENDIKKLKLSGIQKIRILIDGEVKKEYVVGDL